MENADFNILYVDDERQNLISFKSALREYYNIFTAISAEDGMKILHEEEIHLIITDQRMPEVTGVEFLERTIPEFPEIIRMVLTGYSDVDDIIQAINSGRVYRYISKPWDENELKMTIDNALNLYNLKQKNKELLLDLQIKVTEQERILSIFQKYVPAEIVDELLSKTDSNDLFSGENKDIAIMFVDIREFTKISSRMSPKDVVSFLNCFYSTFSTCIKKFNGSVNKYIGDEILAIFGAPVSYENNHLNSILCAVEMRKKLEDINNKFSELTGQTVKIGIGINSGNVVVGTMGSEEKLEYSVAGDPVNVAKRIEAFTKEIDNGILISEKTYSEIPEMLNFKIEPYQLVEIRGKSVPLQLYQVHGYIEE